MLMVFHIETSTSGGLVIHRAFASLNLLRRVTVTCACFFFVPINESNLMGWMHTYTDIKSKKKLPRSLVKGEVSYPGVNCCDNHKEEGGNYGEVEQILLSSPTCNGYEHICQCPGKSPSFRGQKPTIEHPLG
jgi:hypothetical protein